MSWISNLLSDAVSKATTTAKKVQAARPSLPSSGGPGQASKVVPPAARGNVTTVSRSNANQSTAVPRAGAPTPVATSSGGSSGGSGGSGGSSGGGSAYTPPKSTDAPQLEALKRLTSTGHAKVRDQLLANVQTSYTQQDKALRDAFDQRLGQLTLARQDNDYAEADLSFANLANRAREGMETMEQLATQGAGETDVLRGQAMSVRNWQENQREINRSYFDTLRSVNSAVMDLSVDTRNQRINLANDAHDDSGAAHTAYYNQMADSYAQMGNIYANPNSDSHDPDAKAFEEMAKMAESAWTRPPVSDSIINWQGATPQEGRVVTAARNLGTTEAPRKRPEGATLARW